MAKPDRAATAFRHEVDVWSFGSGPEQANELCDLVLDGRKRATATSLHALLIDGDTMPAIGRHSIILDGHGVARCVIRTEGITVAPMQDVTTEFAWREGEGDRSRDFWLQGHRNAFTAEHKALGIPMDDTIPVVFEEFAVVWPADCADEP
jgi:uncharacterized protein YhfF